MCLQRVYSGEGLLTDMTLNAWAVRVVDLKVTLDAIRTIERLVANETLEYLLTVDHLYNTFPIF